MVTPVAQGGLGFDVKRAASIYGTYTMSVYLTALPGGLLADRVLGARLAVLIGGVIIALGHFSMVFHSMTAFYAGMVLIAVGTGLLKPNISRMVGSFYGENDPSARQRDSLLFYMGINVGAVLAPLVCGYMAQGEGLQTLRGLAGLRRGDELALGFRRGGRRDGAGPCDLRPESPAVRARGPRPKSRKTTNLQTAATRALTPADWKRIGAIFIFFLCTILFWAAYEQKGASRNLFALKLVRTEIGGFRFPSSWLQSLTPFFVIVLAPIFSVLWAGWGSANLRAR